MNEVVEKVARAIKDESGAYTVSSAKNSRGERGFYVRRRDSGEDFEPIAGPFATDAEADAEIARIIGRAAIEALREPTPEIEAAIEGYAPFDLAFPSHLAWTAAIDAILKDRGNE